MAEGHYEETNHIKHGDIDFVALKYLHKELTYKFGSPQQCFFYKLHRNLKCIGWMWMQTVALNKKCIFKKENVEVIITLMYLPECTKCIQYVLPGH